MRDRLLRLGMLVLLLLFGAIAAQAAGLQKLELVVGGETLSGAVWTPCAQPPGKIDLRSAVIDGVVDCPLEGQALPLIVISHGARGWFGGHHDTAAALADAGYVVAAVTHPDASRRRWRTERPQAVKRLIDHMLSDWPEHDRLDPQRIGFFGFSRGGYTGLVLLGGEPDFRWFLWHCLFAWSDPMCAAPPEREDAEAAQAAEKQADEQGESFAHDPRIKAAVIAAPIGLVFSEDGLSKASAPIQLWRAEQDELLLYPNHAESVSERLPTPPDYRVVAGAGHYAFLTPCSAEQRARAPALCQDRPGFDRAAFHQRFNAEVLAFFEKTLGAR